MIVPDTKNWTWVVGRACPECGFDASGVAGPEVASLVRENALAWRQLLVSGAIVPGRPDEDTWSNLEYACHVRDVYLRFLGRIDRMLSEDDPLFENWDQDATALDDAYDDQDAERAVEALEANAEALASRLDVVSGAQWERPGRRSDGSTFSVDSITRYMVHDTVHHVWDAVGRP